MTGRQILLVEDDKDLGFLLTHVLNSAGYTVDLATTLAEAWEYLDRNQYALVIADWKLPDGDGTVVGNAARERGAKTIMMSGHLFQLPPAVADAHEIMMKPVRPGELVDAVERLIGQWSAR